MTLPPTNTHTRIAIFLQAHEMIMSGHSAQLSDYDVLWD